MGEPNNVEFLKPPIELSSKESFRQFVWNSDTGQFLGRTGTSWAKIGLFYLIFYSCLAGFFASMLLIFFETLEDEQPKWQQERSLIGTNPGLGYRPMPDRRNHPESTLIWFSSENFDYWVKELNEFLDPYKESMKPGVMKRSCDYKGTLCDVEYVSCDWNTKLDKGQVCLFNISEVQKGCTAEGNYGYSTGKPCVALKLNKIFGLVHEVYKSSEELPSHMPKELKRHIERIELESPEKMDMIWVSCEGENPHDRDLVGRITYKPEHGFPLYYFPYANQPGYINPIVMVQFEKPVLRGVMMNIECKAWAKNIFHDRKKRRGSVHFELMIDPA